MQQLYYFRGFMAQLEGSKPSKLVNIYDPCFIFSEACELLVDNYMDKFANPPRPSAPLAQSGKWNQISGRCQIASEICHVVFEIQELISALDKKIELIQEHLLGLKSNATYAELMSKGLTPDFKDNVWYAWARFLDQFRKEATDPLGKFGGCFLSPANKQHVLTFRSLANDEYTRAQYILFKSVYTQEKEVREHQSNPHPHANPFGERRFL